MSRSSKALLRKHVRYLKNALLEKIFNRLLVLVVKVHKKAHKTHMRDEAKMVAIL